MPGLRDMHQRGATTFKIVPSVIIVEEGHNPRNFDTLRMREKLDALKTSIESQGVISPVWVRKDGEKTVLVDGETRLRASLELIAEGKVPETFLIPAIEVAAMDEMARLLLSLTANTGEPLTLAEHGAAFRRLIGHGLAVADIASKVGLSKRYVTSALDMDDAPKEVKELVSNGEVTPGRAIAEVKKKGSKAGETLKAEVSKAKASGKTGPVKRERAESNVDLKDAVIEVLAEAESQRGQGVMVMEISTSALDALREAMGMD